MKNKLKFLVLGVFAFLLSFAGSVATNTPNPTNDGRFGFRTAIIKAEMTMMGQKMPVTYYIAEYGNRVCVETTVMSMKMRTLMVGNTTYVVNMENKTAMKTVHDDEGEAGGSLPELKFDKLTTAQLKAEGIVKGGKETIAGKVCQIYKMEVDGDKISYWIWKDFSMKTLTETADGMTMEVVVTSVKENATIPPEMFKVPSGFTINEMPVGN